MLRPLRHGDTEKNISYKELQRLLKLSASVSLCLIWFFLVVGCGKKLPPVAPESVVSEPVKNLRVISRDTKLLVTFTKPSKNVDGSKLTDLSGVKIMRRVAEDKAGCKGCPEKFPVVYDIDISYPLGANKEGDRIIFTDADIDAGIKYEYKVVAYNKDGYEGPESPRIAFLWTIPPGRPVNVTGIAGDRTADITWASPETMSDGSPMKDMAGYNIYRREEGGKYLSDPLNPAPVSRSGFSDIGLSNGRTYYYTVRAVIEANESLIEGPSSDEIKVMPNEATVEELKGEPDAPLPVQK